MSGVDLAHRAVATCVSRIITFDIGVSAWYGSSPVSIS